MKGKGYISLDMSFGPCGTMCKGQIKKAPVSDRGYVPDDVAVRAASAVDDKDAT